jgi:hypothetical protein
MLDIFERWVQFHDLYLKREPEEAPKIPLEQLIDRWIARIKAGNSVKLIKKDTAAIRIADVRRATKLNSIVLLLHYTDTNVTDPAFSNLDTGKLRVEPKLDGEGIAVSAHVVINYKPYDEEGVLYKILLEEVPGLGRSNLSPFIKAELKHVSQGLFEYPDPFDNNKVKGYLPAAEILGKPSKQFVEELNEGCVLKGIELVKLTRSSPEIDEEGFYTETSRHIKLIPDREHTKDIAGAVRRLTELAKREGYDDIKFRYKHPQGKQKTATMGSTIGDVADALVNRSEVVKVDEVLDQCSEKVVSSFANGMLKLLKT